MRYKVHVTSRATWIPALPESLKHEFSLEELQQMQQQFCDFDETGDGSIAASELVVLMKSMGIYATLDDVQVLIDKVDDNHSGELEFHEFVRLVSEFRRGDGDKLSEFIQYSKLVLEIRHELHDLTENPTQYSTPCPVKENAWEWKVAVQGPASTPYERGTFFFHVRFGHDYPYEAPMLTCLTRIYHPNFVPLLNGSMAVYGFMERWDPEWRMRGLLERLEQLLNCPDVDLMTAFQNETTARLARVEVSAGAKRMRHPREIALDCIDLFISDADIFFSTAQEFTMKIAAETLEEQQPKVSKVPESTNKIKSSRSTSTMLAQNEEVEVDVRREDQQRINEFGRNNARLYDIRDQKKALQDKLETLDDANTELMMGMGDNVELFIGESFVEASEESAQEFLEKQVEVAKQEVEALAVEEATLDARQAVLKKALYGRFGSSINLEDK